MNVSTANGSSYSTRPSTNKGMSGMISGMDTEGMVESMLSGIQAKIDKQNGIKQQTGWKQETYRDIITSINDFRMKFFDFSSDTNLKSNSFFNNMAALSKSNAFRVTADSSARTGRTDVIVNRLATTTKAESVGKASAELSGDFDANVFNKEIVFVVSGTEVKVNLNGATTDQQVQDRLTTAFAGTGITATVKDGALKISTENKGEEVIVSSKSSKLGLGALGLVAGSKSYRVATNVMGPDPDDPDAPEIVTGQDITYEMNSAVTLDEKVTLEVTLDNNVKTLTFDPNKMVKADGTIDDGLVVDALQKQLNKFGDGQITAVFSTDNKKISLSVTQGRRLFVGGNDALGLQLVGMKQDMSNKLSTSQKLKDLNFAKDLVGSKFDFTINDVEFSFTENDTLSSVISKINASEAGVNIKYMPNEDKFTIESTEWGEGQKITMSQTGGNLLSAMFGVNMSDSVTSDTFLKNNIKSETFKNEDGTNFDTSGLKTKSGVFKITVDGREYSISIPPQYLTDNDGKYIARVKDADGKPVEPPAYEQITNPDGTLMEGKSYESKEYTKDEVAKLVNDGLKSQFGFTGSTQNIELTADGIKVNNGAKVSFGKLTDNYIGADGKPDTGIIKAGIESGKNLAMMFGLIGIEEKNNNIDADTTLADVGLTGTGKLSDLQGFDAKTGRVTLKSADTPFSADMMKKLFGSETIAFGNGEHDPNATGSAQIVGGVNAEITINGLKTERNSNNFTIDGLTFELLEVSASREIQDPDDPTKTITVYDKETVDTTRDTEQIFKGVKAFVDDYNKMIESFNKLIDEDSTYKDYPPLTTAQKAQMSESEVMAWEIKAKTGLLRNDSDISGFLSNMRIGMYNKPEGAKYALYNIGITTTTYENKGKLVIDEKILKQMIQNEPDELQKLFNGDGTNEGAGKGLMNMLEDTIKSTANTSSGDPGSLVRLAGTKSTALVSQNTLSRKIGDINERLKTLQRTYEMNRAKYWKQFNAMEKALSSMTSQSSALMQQFQ